MREREGASRAGRVGNACSKEASLATRRHRFERRSERAGARSPPAIGVPAWLWWRRPSWPCWRWESFRFSTPLPQLSNAETCSTRTGRVRGAGNYAAALMDSRVLGSMFNTILAGGRGHHGAVRAGLGLALVVINELRGKRFIIPLLMLPVMMVPVVVALGWRLLWIASSGQLMLF